MNLSQLDCKLPQVSAIFESFCWEEPDYNVEILKYFQVHPLDTFQVLLMIMKNEKSLTDKQRHM